MDNAEELSKHYQLNHNYVMSEPVRKALPADGHFQEEPELPLLLEMQPMFRELLLWLGLRVVHPYREFAMLKSIHAKLGKTAIGELLAEALPNVVAYKANPTLGWNKATASRFNVAVYGEMISAKVVFFDEMGDCPDVANFPKHITDPAFMLESKGIDARQYKRTAVAVVMGNNYMSFVARNGRADTRFGRAGFIRNMDNCKPLDNEVGIQIRTSEEIGKLGAYFLWCICHAYHNAASLITQFDPAEDKDTKECLEEWHDYVDNGGDANTVESWLCNIASSRNDTGGILAQDVVLLAKKHGYTIQANRIGRLLKACVPNAESGWIRINGKQVRAWKNIHIEGVPRYGVEEESDTQVEIVPLVEQHTVMEVKSSPVVESRVQTPNEPCITCGRYTLYMDSTQCEWCYNNRRANQHIH